MSRGNRTLNASLSNHIQEPGPSTGDAISSGTWATNTRKHGTQTVSHLRPRPSPVSPPSLATKATTPHRVEAPGGEGTEGTPATRSPSPAGTYTSTSTNHGAIDASGSTPSTPEDPQSLNSPTSAQADDECLERLGSGRRSSEPEADSETRPPPAGRTDARRRTAAASTTGGTRSHTAGGTAATPAPSTAGTRGEDAGPGAAAKDE
ncbi:uncharacterized protein [Procambarus clarkii]|uniref:uncharacterized protein n=1 Tax=Procambarus clarkii TaxID=6728 RepID=UPI003742F76E